MRIDSTVAIPIKAEVAELIKNLNVGDNIKGRIMETSEGTVLLKMAGGQTLAAVLTTDVKLQKGQVVELTVNQVSQDKIVASLKENEAKIPNLDIKLAEMLGKMSLPVNDKTVEAAKLLIKYDFPVNKENLTQLVQLEKNTVNLGQIKGEGALGLMLSELDIQNTPVPVLNKIALTSEPDIKTFMSKLMPEQMVLASEKQVSTAVVAEGTKMAVSANSQDHMAEEALVPKQMTTAAMPSTNAQESPETKLPAEQKPSLSGDLVQLLKKINVEMTPEVKTLVDNILKAVDTAGKTNMAAIAFLQSADMEVTPKHLAVLERNINNENKVSEFLEKIQVQIDKTLNITMEKEGAQELRQIKDAIAKVFMQPKQIEDKEAVSDQFKELVKLGEKLESFLNKHNINDSEIKNSLVNLKDNIDFLKNINQYNNYLQIPVMINQNPTTADVYVFKENKKGKTINPQNATILIALDLKHLGYLESMINVMQKQVNVTFRVQDKKIGDVIESGSKDLSAALAAKGYQLNPIKVIKLEQPFNIISLQTLLQEGNIEKMHFDVRA